MKSDLRLVWNRGLFLLRGGLLLTMIQIDQVAILLALYNRCLFLTDLYTSSYRDRGFLSSSRNTAFRRQVYSSTGVSRKCTRKYFSMLRMRQYNLFECHRNKKRME